jgi:hypothetical protein
MYFRCFTVWLCCYVNVYGAVHTTVPSEDTLVTHQVRFQGWLSTEPQRRVEDPCRLFVTPALDGGQLSASVIQQLRKNGI